MYPKDSNQYKAITRKLTIFVGSSSVACSIVENLEFVDFLNTINPRYSVPGRAAIHKELDLELRAKIATHIESSNRFSICCNVWSKKGLTASYLSVTQLKMGCTAYTHGGTTNWSRRKERCRVLPKNYKNKVYMVSSRV